MREGRT